MSLRPFARRLAGGQRGSVLFLLKDKTFRSLLSIIKTYKWYYVGAVGSQLLLTAAASLSLRAIRSRIDWIANASSGMSAYSRYVLVNLGEWASCCTKIIIAHRLSTIRDADYIVFLEPKSSSYKRTFPQLLGEASKYARPLRGKNSLPHGRLFFYCPCSMEREMINGLTRVQADIRFDSFSITVFFSPNNCHAHLEQPQQWRPLPETNRSRRLANILCLET